MTDFKVREEVLRLITGGTLRENIDAYLNLARRYHDELDSLAVDNEESIVRAAFIGREAVAAGNIVFEQVQQKTLETGHPPLSKEELIEMHNATRSIRPKTLSTLVRTTPGIFGPAGEQILAASKRQTGLTMRHLGAAYIASAREAKDLLEQDPGNESDRLYDFLFRSILICLAILDEAKGGEAIEKKIAGRKGAVKDAVIEAFFAKLATAAAAKVMQGHGLQFSPGGLQVDVIEGDGAPVTLIRIPVKSDAPIARANSDMNAILAKVFASTPGFQIPRGVVFSFRRVQ